MANWLCLKLLPRKLVIIWVACYRLFQINVLRKVYVVLSFEINLRVAWDRRRQVVIHLSLKADLWGGAGLLSRKWPRLQQHASNNPCFNILAPNHRFWKDVSHLEWHLFCYLGSSQPTNSYLHWSVPVDRHTQMKNVHRKIRTHMHASILMFYYVLDVSHQLYIKPKGSIFLGQQLLPKSSQIYSLWSPSSNHQLCIPFQQAWKYNSQSFAHCQDIEHCKYT